MSLLKKKRIFCSITYYKQKKLHLIKKVITLMLLNNFFLQITFLLLGYLVAHASLDLSNFNI